jgi:outer membrane protein OmpA-like peptidoglycan-associated protein
LVYPGDSDSTGNNLNRFSSENKKKRDIIAALGPPDMECMRHYPPAGEGTYVFCFSADKLISKSFEPPSPPPPIVHHRTCANFYMVFFPAGSAVLSAQGQSTLNLFAKDCQPRNGQRVTVWGHADGENSLDQVSQARAEAVRAYLLSIGFTAQSLVVEAYGDTMPLAGRPDRDELGRTQNRRVEVFLK